MVRNLVLVGADPSRPDLHGASPRSLALAALAPDGGDAHGAAGRATAAAARQLLVLLEAEPGSAHPVDL